jgi:transcription elongation factor Elf1
MRVLLHPVPLVMRRIASFTQGRWYKSHTVVWRAAQLSDISALGQHIATGYLTNVDPRGLRRAADKVIAAAKAAIGDLYMTRRASDRATVEMVRTVWSFTYCCPACKAELVFFEALRNGGTAGPGACSNCATPFVKRSWARAHDVPVRGVWQQRRTNLGSRTARDP